MHIEDVLGSPPFVLLGMGIARTLPKGIAYGLSRSIAAGMRRRRNEMFRTVRANIAQVVGPGVPPERLDEMAERAIFHAGCTYYDMFRQSKRSLARYDIVLRASPEGWDAVRGALSDHRGVILVGAHTSNFDLAAQWMAAQGVEIQALSLASPDLGTRVVNEIRRRRGLVVTPIQTDALRSAIRRLREGGVVLTGVDRPVGATDDPIEFFGKPARLPTGHVRLALQTNSRIVVASCIQEPTGAYAVHVSPPLEMERTYVREEDIRRNTRRVLAIIEEMIRLAPDQWLMFVPVWPEEDAQASSSSSRAARS